MKYRIDPRTDGSSLDSNNGCTNLSDRGFWLISPICLARQGQRKQSVWIYSTRSWNPTDPTAFWVIFNVSRKFLKKQNKRRRICSWSRVKKGGGACRGHTQDLLFVSKHLCLCLHRGFLTLHFNFTTMNHIIWENRGGTVRESTEKKIRQCKR